MRVVLALDPGERHTGWAQAIETRRAAYSGWAVSAGTLHDGGEASWLTDRLESSNGSNMTVVVESFVLYPGQDQKRVFQPMGTSELIGKIKLLCEMTGAAVVEQNATIKKPTRRQLRARGIAQVGRGPHARDAELHLYHYMLKEGLLRGPIAQTQSGTD